MYSFDIAWSILGLISFLLFMLFYKKLKPSPFWGKMHPAQTWAMWQIIFSSPRVGTLMYELIRGNDVHIFSILVSAVVFALTGIFMMRLANKVKKAILDQRLTKDINNQLGELGKRSKGDN